MQTIEDYFTKIACYKKTQNTRMCEGGRMIWVRSWCFLLNVLLQLIIVHFFQSYRILQYTFTWSKVKTLIVLKQTLSVCSLFSWKSYHQPIITLWRQKTVSHLENYVIAPVTILPHQPRPGGNMSRYITIINT